jgi:selenocysteine lyase/cysteine desulfurase
VSPLYQGAAAKEREIAETHARDVAGLLSRFLDIQEDLRRAAASLLKTSPDNLALVKNTSDGMGMIANGYRFEQGDQIITYVHEYPANYYPWRLQERRGAELLLLPNRGMDGDPAAGSPVRWSMEDLESMVTDRTRILAISHVQFTSGFAADLKSIGDFCRDRGIDLVVDAAQSLGAMPVFPEENHIAAVVSSGWKWLMGPLGCGLMYTSEAFRAKLTDVMVGAGTMIQGWDFLNHSWHPHHTARRFEYSTPPLSLTAALTACITDLFLDHTPETIFFELIRLQDLMLDRLDRDRFSPLLFADRHRSGILSVRCLDHSPEKISEELAGQMIITTTRGGYLRLAPHFYNSDDEIEKAASILNAIKI